MTIPEYVSIVVGLACLLFLWRSLALDDGPRALHVSLPLRPGDRRQGGDPEEGEEVMIEPGFDAAVYAALRNALGPLTREELGARMPRERSAAVSGAVTRLLSAGRIVESEVTRRTPAGRQHYVRVLRPSEGPAPPKIPPPNHRPRSGKAGHVTSALTVHCGDCQATCAAPDDAPAVRAGAYWRSLGWQGSPNVGWMCPECWARYRKTP